MIDILWTRGLRVRASKVTKMSQNIKDLLDFHKQELISIGLPSNLHERIIEKLVQVIISVILK